MSNGCGFGSMAKVGQESDKEQKGGTRSPRGLCTDKTRLMDGRGPGRGDSRSSRAAGGGAHWGNVASYRKRDGGHFSQRGRPFPVHDHHETQTKMADSGKKTGTGKRGGETARDTERKRKMGKDGNQAPGDRGGSRDGKRTITA
jgi:hypothetical protein